MACAEISNHGFNQNLWQYSASGDLQRVHPLTSWTLSPWNTFCECFLGLSWEFDEGKFDPCNPNGLHVHACKLELPSHRRAADHDILKEGLLSGKQKLLGLFGCFHCHCKHRCSCTCAFELRQLSKSCLDFPCHFLPLIRALEVVISVLMPCTCHHGNVTMQQLDARGWVENCAPRRERF